MPIHLFPRPISRALSSALLALGVACNDEVGPRVYTAMAYEPEAGCLEDYAPIGLVETTDLASTCDPVCLGLAGRLYVSSVCQPYPSEIVPVAPDESPNCHAALAAADAGASCAQVVPPEAGGAGGD